VSHRWFTLNAREEKSHKSLSDKNALTDQDLEQGELHKREMALRLRLIKIRKRALDF
jgi:hypothetical protein